MPRMALRQYPDEREDIRKLRVVLRKAEDPPLIGDCELSRSSRNGLPSSRLPECASWRQWAIRDAFSPRCAVFSMPDKRQKGTKGVRSTLGSSLKS